MINHDAREEFPMIVIDALDECAGLRHDSSGRRDYQALLRTIKRWGQVDHLKKFKLVITSRLDEDIERKLPEIINSPFNIPSGSDVKPGDSASNDIRAYLKYRLDGLKMGDAWVRKALDYLVPCAAGMFIWATTVADFLRENSARRLDILKIRRQEDGSERFKDLYLPHTTVVTTSFGRGLEEEEIEGVIPVMGAMIAAKQPLNNNAPLMLPGVGNWDMLGLIREGLVSVIESGSILRFHHRSFEDFLLSSLFRQEFPKLSAVNQNLHKRQLAILCL